jgi:hypothetical protein
MDLNFIWCLVIIVILLNFIYYIIDPLKYTEDRGCLKLPCRKFTLFNQVLGIIFDILIIIVISSLVGFKPTSIIYVTFSFLLFVIVVSWFAARPVVKNEKINPPPQLFFKKNIRIVIQIIILLLDITIFFLLFMIRSGIDINNKGILFGFIDLINSRFGGNVKGNRVIFTCGWIVFLGIFQNIYNLYNTIIFYPSHYNLPLSWRI